ncbi:MAG: hypothetical protein WD200_02485 [Candidatus Andersenbacteria bacterium]
MDKTFVIVSVVAGFLVVIALFLWRFPEFAYAPESNYFDTQTQTFPSEEELGIADLTAEADSEIVLDENFDSDIQQLEVELGGL